MEFIEYCIFSFRFSLVQDLTKFHILHCGIYTKEDLPL